MADPYPPISDYALLSDCHSGALVSRDGSIDWCAFHRFEARPVFARLLDWKQGGFFRIAPAGDYEATRRYLPNTNVLETRFETADGVITLTDALVVRVEEGHPDHRLIRRVQCESGEVAVKARFEPRFDYGLTEPRVELVEDDLAIAYGGPDALVLQTELPIGTAEVSACEAARTLTEGDDALVALTWCLPQELKAERQPRELILGELDGHDRLLAGLGRALRIRRAVPGGSAPKRARPQGPDELADRSDRGGGDHVAPGGDRRRAQLGLPLLLAPRLSAHGQCAVHARLHGGGARLRDVAQADDGREPEVAPDHVRRRRASASCRRSSSTTSTATAGRGRCGSATARRSSSSSTSTARCSTRPGTTGATAARSTTSSGSSCAGSATP